MPDKNYSKWITKVKSVEQQDGERPSYLIEFENGLSMMTNEMKYKQYMEPKPGQEYTIINSSQGTAVLKNYGPTKEKAKRQHQPPWKPATKVPV